jgi:hypothetical protein
LLHDQKLEIEAIQNCIFIKDKNPKIALSSNLEDMNKNFANLTLDRFSLSSFDLYNTVGQKITLSEPVTNFNSIVVRCGINSTKQNSGITFMTLPRGFSLEDQYNAMWVVNGNFESLTYQFNSQTEIEILSVSSTSLASGIRQVYGVGRLAK